MAGQGRSGLVHDDDVSVHAQSFGNLYHLLIGDAESRHRDPNIDMYVEFPQFRLRLSVEISPLDEGASCGLPSQIHVFSGVEVRDQVKLLVDDRDTEVQSPLGRIDVHFFPLQEYSPDIFLVCTGENSHQCGLAGSVFSEQNMHFALLHFKSDVVQGMHTWEGLVDVFHQKNSLAVIVHTRLLSVCLKSEFSSGCVVQ